MRSVASGWAKGSVVAVDAGVHLSAIKTILEQTQPATLGQPDGPALPHTLATGPFAGLTIPNVTADANATHIHADLIEAYLLTHPHLDHIAGFVINTAGLPGTRPKRVAGLPSTITALKTHVFNNVIWPNLSDENNGAGLVTYMRLVEGGSPALGEGEGKGYLEICGGLAVKILSVSHGHCIERHSHRGSSSTRHGSFDASSLTPGPLVAMPSPSRNLPPHTSLPTNIGAILQQHERLQASPARRGSAFSVGPAVDESVCVYDSSVYFIRDIATGREILIFGDVEPDSVSLSPRNRQVWQEAAPRIAAGNLAAIFIECSYDDSRCVERLFGHLTPRFIREEMTALAEEVLAARHERDRAASQASSASSLDKKRKRLSDDASQAKRKSTPQPTPARDHPRSDHPVSPKSLLPRRRVNSTASSASDHDLDLPASLLPLPTHALRSSSSTTSTDPDPNPPLPLYSDTETHDDADSVPDADADADMSPTTTTTTTASMSLLLPLPTSHPHQLPGVAGGVSSSSSPSLRGVLSGLRVVIMHVKERMADGARAGDVILEELRGHEREGGLGVEYAVSGKGDDFFF